MKKAAPLVDSVRASRDGHEFHEAWAARKALQLVMPSDELVGIAVEGLSPVDQSRVDAKTIQIADLVFYRGRESTFDGANTVTILQVKYSVAKAPVDVRAAEATQTIRKFAHAFRTHKRQYGAIAVRRKLFFELVTNRPISKGLSEALDCLASQRKPKGDAKRQAAQLAAACDLKGKDLCVFARNTRITGHLGSLQRIKQGLAKTLADWSPARDTMARAQLGGMKQLLRDKAGLVGEGRNVITRVDVLEALQLQSAEDLFPCPDSFPPIGVVLQRRQLAEAIGRIESAQKPLLVHADGGVGKTVFLQSLVSALSQEHVTVLFDCFGGGSYRAPGDARHLPRRGLIHIANLLAVGGSCDPLIPASDSSDDLILAFRRRLSQAVATLRSGAERRKVILFIDAIDNAAQHAQDRGDPCFPKLLLESLHHHGSIDGVHVVMSCRTHRRRIATGGIPCEELELKAFDEGETREYLRARLPGATDSQVDVAHARSGGNPRVLEHLAGSDRGLLDLRDSPAAIRLDDLIAERIKLALAEALKRGYPKQEIEAFLAGLAVLPPPVPMDEYAQAHGMDPGEVRSFATDLAPLLEQTRHGLLFRDEPTETYIRDVYAANEAVLRTLAGNLTRKQGSSVYAASALPGLLESLSDGKLLFELAFDDRIPSAVTSTVGRRKIRYARILAAVTSAAKCNEFGRLVRLLVELSTLANSNQRGSGYVVDNPDLVIAANDVDATRRLMESRAPWPGTRHARLAIASVLAGDIHDAEQHIVRAKEWMRHWHYQSAAYKSERGGPKPLDIAAVAVCLVAQKNGKGAAKFMRQWKDGYAFEVGIAAFGLLNQAQAMQAIASKNVRKFVKALKLQVGTLTAALVAADVTDAQRRAVLRALATACRKQGVVEAPRDYYSAHSRIWDGLLQAAGVAVVVGAFADAEAIVATIPSGQPRLLAFRFHHPGKDASWFVIRAAICAVAGGRDLSERSMLPGNLAEVAARVPDGTTGDAFCSALRTQMDAWWKEQGKDHARSQSATDDEQHDLHLFLEERLMPLTSIGRATVSVLGAKRGDADEPFLRAMTVWATARTTSHRYAERGEANRFLDSVARECLAYCVAVRGDLGARSVATFVDKLAEYGDGGPHELVEIVKTIARRPSLQEVAGRSAQKAMALIEHEDAVDWRSSLMAHLARAILPASREEAVVYFRAGLEQLDIIGSGDYQLTNELLLFAAELRGEELAEHDFHALANISELNMTSEESKFPWLAFARGLARTSGVRGLARLSRWADREKVSFNYTLLPYLVALIEQGKMDSAVALAVLRLSDPAELHVCGTAQLARTIDARGDVDRPELLQELMRQFEGNNPGVFMPDTVAALAQMAKDRLGEDSPQAAYLAAAAPRVRKLCDEVNEHANYHGGLRAGMARPRKSEEKSALAMCRTLGKTCDPNDEVALIGALDALGEMERGWSIRSRFLDEVRARVGYGQRPSYVVAIATAETLPWPAKLAELKACKERWLGDALSMGDAMRQVGELLVRRNPAEFVFLDCLSTSTMQEVVELSGISMPALALELVVQLAAPNAYVPAAVWMGLAAVTCERTTGGEPRAALSRLLSSDAAKLAATVVDGPWEVGKYPGASQTEVAAGLIWLTLGSPYAANRWRAAHSIRCCARFGRWDVIDAVIGKMTSTGAHPYQAPELPFFFLHARMWLCIALARLARDHAEGVAKYADALRAVALDKEVPHILLRRFAADALLTCADAGVLAMGEGEAQALRENTRSPFPMSSTKDYAAGSFYQMRSDSNPAMEPEFCLEYEFGKSDVTRLTDLFGMTRWDTENAITAVVRKWDANIASMWENARRHTPSRHKLRGMNAQHQTYGQQLGWHALHIVAGEFLAAHRVVKRPYDDDDPWGEWLRRRGLTRADGLWVADGVDRVPLGVQVTLLKKGRNGIVLTGESGKILGLLGMEEGVGEEWVVGGDWSSADNVAVSVASALVAPRHAGRLAVQLSKENPFRAWLPRLEEHEDGRVVPRADERGFRPWIVGPSEDLGLDETDPLGVGEVVRRLRFARGINAVGGLTAADPFKRVWKNAKGDVLVRSEAWGRNRAHEEEDRVSGHRIVCSKEFVKQVLAKQSAELLVLVVLRKYEKGFGSRTSQYWHTTAVMRVTASLKRTLRLGKVNDKHMAKY